MNPSAVLRGVRLALGLGGVLVVAMAFAEEPRATWPQWRGPERDARLPGAVWPDKLQGQALEQLWRVELGPSYSGPIVTDDRVFVTETKDKSDEIVRALDRKTGKEIWKASWKGALRVNSMAMVNGDWIRSTPAYDGKALYVGGMRDVIVCLEAADGKERWRTDLTKELGVSLQMFGYVCSPAVDEQGVYVQTHNLLAKLDKTNGKVLWTAGKKPAEEKLAGRRGRFPGGRGGFGPPGRGMMGGMEDYPDTSSPILAKVGGRNQLVAHVSNKLTGLDPADGKVLWVQAVPIAQGGVIVTPTLCGPDGVFSSAGRSLRIDLEAKPDQGIEVKKAWEVNVRSNMASPVVVGEQIYVLNAAGRLVCLDVATGKERWTSTKRFGKYWSMVGGKDRILALDEQGVLYLVKANPEKFELLDSRKVSQDETWAYLAVCGDEVFVRELKAMAVYRWRNVAGETEK
jgi:outer membrane protein assembly factor BamB